MRALLSGAHLSVSVISEGLQRNQKAGSAGIIKGTVVMKEPSAWAWAELRGPTGDVEAVGPVGEHPFPAEPRGCGGGSPMTRAGEEGPPGTSLGVGGGQEAESPCFQCRGPGLNPWSGN